MGEELALFKNKEGIGITGFEYILLAIEEVLTKNLEYIEAHKEEEDNTFIVDDLLVCLDYTKSLLNDNYFEKSDEAFDQMFCTLFKDDGIKYFRKWNKEVARDLNKKKADTKKLFNILNDMQELI